MSALDHAVPSAPPGRTQNLPRALALLVLGSLLLGFTPPDESPPPATSKELPLPLVRPDGRPLSPLALAGREVVAQQGCRACHAAATGERSEGRPGPSLAQVGGALPDLWHVRHLVKPSSVSASTIMPSYAHLADKTVDVSAVARALAEQRHLAPARVPSDAAMRRTLRAEGRALVKRLVAGGGETLVPDSALVAVVAWLQEQTAPELPRAATPLPAAEKTFDAEIRRDAAALAPQGAAAFGRICAACHGANAQGPIGPSLVDSTWRYGRTPSKVFRSIADGHPAKGMPSFVKVFTPDELRALTAYVSVTLGEPK